MSTRSASRIGPTATLVATGAVLAALVSAAVAVAPITRPRPVRPTTPHKQTPRPPCGPVGPSVFTAAPLTPAGVPLAPAAAVKVAPAAVAVKVAVATEAIAPTPGENARTPEAIALAAMSASTGVFVRCRCATYSLGEETSGQARAFASIEAAHQHALEQDVLLTPDGLYVDCTVHEVP